MPLLEDLFLHAKTGDRVWSILRGSGNVIENLNGASVAYPVLVQFDFAEPGATGIFAYTNSGMCHQHTLYPELFWKKQKPGCITIKPKPDIDWKCVPVNTPVFVFDADSDGDGKATDLSSYVARQFVTYMPAIGKFVCFSKDKDSESSESMNYWTHCILDPKVKIPPEWEKIPF